MSFFNSIPQFSTFRFSPWSKKILRISPANLGKNPSRGQESLLSKLDIQTGISWAFDIEIKRFKSSNSSTFPGLQLWWRIQTEINSFWITELQPNSAGNLLAARFYVFTLDFQQEYLEFLILKSSNSKAQIHLRVPDYKFDEGVEVR